MRKLNKAPSASSLIIFPTPGGGRDPFLPSPLRRARPTLDPPDVAVVGALGLLCPRPAVGVEPLPHAPYDVFFVCPRLPRSRRIREGSRGGGGGSNDCSPPPPTGAADAVLRGGGGDAVVFPDPQPPRPADVPAQRRRLPGADALRCGPGASSSSRSSAICRNSISSPPPWSRWGPGSKG